MRFAPGILPSQAIEALAAAGHIRVDEPLATGQVQPASLDLRLGRRVFTGPRELSAGSRHSRVRADRPPYAARDRPDPGRRCWRPDAVYIAELLETSGLPPGLAAAANPKSSTGRLDVFTRVICGWCARVRPDRDRLSGSALPGDFAADFSGAGADGIAVVAATIRSGAVRLDDADWRRCMRGPAGDVVEPNIQSGIAVSVDPAGLGKDRLVGYRAKRHTGLVDVDKVGACEVRTTGTRFTCAERRELVLDPDEFYILASLEAVHPPGRGGRNAGLSTLRGRIARPLCRFLRSGLRSCRGRRRRGAAWCWRCASRDVPFILEDGQAWAALRLRADARAAGRALRPGLGSNYQAQGLKLSKHFV